MGHRALWSVELRALGGSARGWEKASAIASIELPKAEPHHAVFTLMCNKF